MGSSGISIRSKRRNEVAEKSRKRSDIPVVWDSSGEHKSSGEKERRRPGVGAKVPLDVFTV